jgi:hypothetical protein
VTTYGGGVLHIQVKSLIHGGEIKAKYVNIVVSDKIVVFIQKPLEVGNTNDRQYRI